MMGELDFQTVGVNATTKVDLDTEISLNICPKSAHIPESDITWR